MVGDGSGLSGLLTCSTGVGGCLVVGGGVMSDLRSLVLLK